MKLTGITKTIRGALAKGARIWPLRKKRITHRAPSREPAVQPGQFVARSYSNAAGTRAYKLYIPKSYSGTSIPLIVMLHGCGQTPDEFAAGTRMNELADQHKFIVVYPAQSTMANGLKCWNWFESQDQKRDFGEPSLIAGIAREVSSTFQVDDARVYVAGLSAGAAMAVILGATYPDLFAAVGAHSGLPYRAAHNAGSAIAAMLGNQLLFDRAADAKTASTIPTIVFHGDHDTTVNARNGAQIVAHAISFGGLGRPLTKIVKERMAVNGREHTTTVYHDAESPAIVEHWVLHGGGHAWSGGSVEGSHTDEMGPDASAEMVRFFLAQRKSPNSART